MAAAVAAAQAEGWAGKVPAVAFVIDWSESNRADCWRVFSTWQEINQHVRYIAEDAPKTGAYHKTGFVITWANGDTYTGRLDIQHHSRPAPGNDNDLARHVYDHVFFHAGLATAETLPSHLTMADYLGLLRAYGDDTQRKYMAIWEAFDIPQADHLGQPLPVAVAAITRAIVADGMEPAQPEASPMEELKAAVGRLEVLAQELAADPVALAQFHALPETAGALGKVSGFVAAHQPQQEPVKVAQPSQAGDVFANSPYWA